MMRIPQNNDPIVNMISDAGPKTETNSGASTITLYFAIPIEGVRTITMNKSPAGAVIRILSG